MDSLQQQITSLSSSLSTGNGVAQHDNDDMSHSEEDKRELVVVDGQEREIQKGVMIGEEKEEEEVGGKESNEDEAEDMAEQRPEGGGDGKVNNEGFLGEVISGILNGNDGEVES